MTNAATKRPHSGSDHNTASDHPQATGRVKTEEDDNDAKKNKVEDDDNL